MIPFIRLGTLLIPTYFLVISVSLSALLVFLSYRVEHFKKSRKVAFDLALVLMLAGFLGGRLMHVFYEEWPYYQANPELILYFWNGGFVFLGGLFACLIAGYAFTKIRKISFPEWADFFTPIFSLAHALGRIGCVLSGCCFGIQCDLPWSLDGRHPTALYLVLGELLIFILIMLFEKRKKKARAGRLFSKWLLLHSLLRFNVEYYRDDFRGLFIKFPLLGSLSISQMLSLFIIASTLVFLAWPYLKKANSHLD